MRLEKSGVRKSFLEMTCLHIKMACVRVIYARGLLRDLPPAGTGRWLEGVRLGARPDTMAVARAAARSHWGVHRAQPAAAPMASRCGAAALRRRFMTRDCSWESNGRIFQTSHIFDLPTQIFLVCTLLPTVVQHQKRRFIKPQKRALG